VPQDKAHKMGKSVWMTEITNDGKDWKSFMDTAKDIHNCLTIANYNAYVYFWYRDIGKYVGIVDNNHDISSRGYVIGQFAKYVRPGYFRIDATSNPQNDIYVSAYKGNGKVIIN
jgi:glucuronoarabinoxylan endo-1,4-beta-xylanase